MRCVADLAKGANGNLEIRTGKLSIDTLPLSYPLARAIAANVDEISNLVLNQATFGEVAAKDMAYALVVATSHDEGIRGAGESTDRTHASSPRHSGASSRAQRLQRRRIRVHEGRSEAFRHQ